MELIYFNVFMGGSIYENITSTFEANVNGLAPEKEYVVYAIGETADGKFTPLAKSFFTTPAHVEASVTATATIAEVNEWSAKFNVTLSEGAVGYKVGCWTKETVDYNPDVDWAYQVSILEGMATDPVFTLIDLMEESSYVAFFIAYNADGSYGAVSRVEFKTTPVTPVHNVAAYNALLGNWTLSYRDNQNTRYEDDIAITISENIAGKLLNIKGLLGAGGSVYGDSGDDTVVARYLEDGTIQIDWSRGVADISDYAQAYEVYCSLIIGNSIYYQGPQIWAENGVYHIGNPTDTANSGYAFGAWSKSNGEFAGIIGGAHYDVTMKKVADTSSASASTEKFSRQETVSPTWKAVTPARIEKSNLSPMQKSGFDKFTLVK